MIMEAGASFAVLFLLVVQNTAIVLSTKHSYRPSAKEYSPSKVVFLSECLKLCTCVVVVYWTKGWVSVSQTLSNTRKSYMLALPSLLYVLQNNAHFVAIKNLPLYVYIMAAQGKVITTALFSVLMLKKKLLARQQLALSCLMLGLILAQFSTEEEHLNPERVKQDYLLGALAVALSTFISGFAGVFLESRYKGKTHSLWEMNLHLSMFSLPFAFLMCALPVSEEQDLGFTSGMDLTVIIIVILKALGGLIVACVMQYADSLLKNFSVAVSICVCVAYSIHSGEKALDLKISTGVMCVFASIFMYSSKPFSSHLMPDVWLVFGYLATFSGAIVLILSILDTAHGVYYRHPASFVIQKNASESNDNGNSGSVTLSYVFVGEQINNFTESRSVQKVNAVHLLDSRVHGPTRVSSGLQWYKYENVFVTGGDHVHYYEGKNQTFTKSLRSTSFRAPEPYQGSPLTTKSSELSSNKLYHLKGTSVLVGCWRRTSHDTNPAHYMMGVGKLYTLLNDGLEPFHIDNVILFQCANLREAAQTSLNYHDDTTSDNFIKAVWRIIYDSGRQRGWFDSSTRIFSIGHDNVGPKSLMFAIENALIDHAVGKYLGMNQPPTIKRWRNDLANFFQSTTPELWKFINNPQDSHKGICPNKLKVGIFQRRNTSNKRRFINLKEVIRLVREVAGQVEIISLDVDSSFYDAALMMNSYDIFVSPHGSQLANGMLALSMPSIIEVVPVCWNNDFESNLRHFSLSYEISAGHLPKNVQLAESIQGCNECRKFDDATCRKSLAVKAIQSDIHVNLTILAESLKRAVSIQCEKSSKYKADKEQ